MSRRVQRTGCRDAQPWHDSAEAGRPPSSRPRPPFPPTDQQGQSTPSGSEHRSAGPTLYSRPPQAHSNGRTPQRPQPHLECRSVGTSGRGRLGANACQPPRPIQTRRRRTSRDVGRLGEYEPPTQPRPSRANTSPAYSTAARATGARREASIAELPITLRIFASGAMIRTRSATLRRS